MMVSIIVTHKYRRLFLLAAFVFTMLCISITAFILSAKPVQAATACTTHFLCAANLQGAVSDWDGSIELEASAPSGAAGDDDNPRQVRAGDTIRVHTWFTVNSNSDFGGQVLAWVNADIGNDCGGGVRAVGPGQECGQNGGFSNFDRSPAVGTLVNPPNSNTQGPANGYDISEPPIKINNCPSFYASDLSHYWDGGGIGGLDSGTTYPVTSPNQPLHSYEYVSSCGWTGASVMWHGNLRNPGTTYNYSFDFKVSPLTLNQNRMCFRANISVGSGSAQQIVTNLYARSPRRLCFEVAEAQVQGLVTSSNVTATGKSLGGVRVYYSRTCNPSTHLNYAVTGGNGLYTFSTTQDQEFCVYGPNAPDGSYGLPQTYDGTSYTSYAPSGYANRTCGAGFCNRYDFVLTPTEFAPTIMKSVSPVAGSDLRPGDPVDFTITVTNAYDNNVKNVDIRDYIPLNIISTIGDPRYPRIVSFQRYNYPGGPSGWNAASAGAYSGGSCLGSGFPINFSYGGGPTILSSNMRCGYDLGGGATPPSLFLLFDRMPAYSQTVITWRGYVKPANEIGVYPGAPGDYRYCNGVGNYNNPGFHSECEDKNTGLQGVANFAYTSAELSFAPQYSGITYNPIPGDLTLAKSVTTDLGDNDGDSINEYDPADPLYNKGTYAIAVTPDPTRGPIEYQVIDQNNGANNFNANLLDPIIRPAIDCSAAATVSIDCGDSVKWNFLNWPFNLTAGSFSFRVIYKDLGQPNGSVFTNTAKACWKKYWEVGHNPACRASNSLPVERATVNEPFFGAKRGGVHAGGDFIAAQPGICLTTDSFGGLAANRRSYGQYVVSAKGDVGDVASLIGIKDQGACHCRSNVLEEVNTYMARGAAYSDTMPAVVLNHGTDALLNNRGYSGGRSKVLRTSPAGSDATIDNSGITISKRFTLKIDRDLYIKGNIKNDPSTQLLSGQPSLGIVVDGDVYIENDVDTIDALIFATGKINTCSKGPGRSLQNQFSPGFNGYTAAECKVAPLKVNGILMGKAVQFARTWKTNGPIPEAEVVELIGQAYVLPPPGFTKLMSEPTSATVREKQPRF